MGLIWGHKNACQPWGWVTGRRNERVKMLPPHPCLLLPPSDPIALCCPGNWLSKKEPKLSKGPKFSALPPCLSVGRRKGV